jgi:phospholipid/cholesterol/gamma-HCH transport system substrate-binding protein
MAFGRKKHPQDPGISPVKAGVIALIVIAVGSYFGFTRANPFASPYKLTAVFRSANNLQTKSPVREAGVNVGKVTEVKAIPGGTGAARVTMELSNDALPIHKDLTLKIRPRIFLEGNFFVDLQPGSPNSPVVKKNSGFVVPVNQTATPVQFGDVLQALQADTRKNLQRFLDEYAKGLSDGGAEGWRQAVKSWVPAYRYGSLANEATLGTQPHDLSTVEKGQAKVFRALDVHEQDLKDLITNFNITAAAFAREDQPLEQAIPALDATLRVGTPALQQLNNALPALRAFARDALPAAKSSGPTIDASMPFVTQARRLVSQRELKGLTRDLMIAIPPLAKLNHDSIPLLGESRELSSCQNQVLLPFATTPIPDPEMEAASGNGPQPFYKQAPRGLVGLSGESRINDANTGMFHVQVGGGPFTIFQTDNYGQKLFGQSPYPLEATRPAKPPKRPVFRPDVPCETQQAPDLHAPKGTTNIDKSLKTPIIPTSQLPPELAKLHDNALLITERLQTDLARQKQGLPTVDPLGTPSFKTQDALAKEQGLKWDGAKLIPLGTGK